MKCKNVTKLVKAWLDGELEPARARLVERHVAECPDCRAQAADFGEISLAVRSYAAGPVPALDVGRVLERSRQCERESARIVTALRHIAAAAAIILFVSGVGALVFERGPAPDDVLASLDPVLDFMLSDPTWADEI
jgi:anti-sigma factor RsiW